MDIITKSDRPHLQIQLFGEPAVSVAGRRTVALRSRPIRLLLAYLLLQSAETIESEENIAEETERSVSYKTLQANVWPEGCSDSNLRHRLIDLRAILGENVLLQGARSEVRLDLTRLTADVLEFEALINQNPTNYAEAVRLYRGELLPEDDLDWIIKARESLKKKYQQALKSLVLCAETDRDSDAHEKYLLRLTTTEPANARWQSALMKLYVTRQDIPSARKVYQKYLGAISRDALPDAEITRLADSLSRPLSDDRKRRAALPFEEPEDAPCWHGFPLRLEPIIGRAEEMQRIATAFVLEPTITLTGPPGIGKTFLALHAAAKIQSDYPDGGAFVDLETIKTSDHMLRRVAYAVGAPLLRDASEDRLKGLIFDILKQKRFLLVLDQCGHLLESVSNLAKDLLRECEHLRILVTSQAALRSVRGEYPIEVPPLLVPADPAQQRLSPKYIRDLPEYPGVALFVREAEASQPKFTLTEDNARAVASLCYVLGGLPLAIKITAGLLTERPPQGEKPLEAILRLIKQERKLLDLHHPDKSIRHLTLRAALDTSFGLLAPEIANHFVFLSVFQGGWTLEAAQEVLGEGAESSLLQLKARSLVTNISAHHAISSRFRLLEPIRRFCEDHLVGHREEAAVRTRHLQYYAHLAERLEKDLAGPDQESALDQLERERDNIDSALAWAAGQGDREDGWRLVGAVWRFWYVRGIAKEGVERLESLMKSTGDASKTYARALRAAGNLAFQRNDLQHAERLYAEQLNTFTQLEDPYGVAGALGSLGNIAIRLGELDVAQQRYLQSQKIFREIGEILAVARTLDNLAIIACAKEDYGKARALNHESITLFRELGDGHNEAIALNNLVHTEMEAHNYSGAVQALRESKDVCLTIEDRHTLVQCLFLHFSLAIKLGLYERAALLLGASDAHRESLGLPLHTAAIKEYHANTDTIRLHLGDRNFEALVTSGRERELKSVLDHAWESFDRVLLANAFLPHLEP